MSTETRTHDFLPLGDQADDALRAVHRLDGIGWASKALLGRLRNLGLIEVREDLWRTTELGAAVATACIEHDLRTSRRQLGRGAVRGSGMRYGVNGKCSGCDWTGYSNESIREGGERDVRAAHAEHLAEVLGAEVAR